MKETEIEKMSIGGGRKFSRRALFLFGFSAKMGEYPQRGCPTTDR